SGWLSFRAAKYHDHASRHYKALAEQKDLSLDDQRKLEQEVRNQLEKAIKHYDNAVTTLEQTAVSLRKEKVLHPRQAGDFESQAGRAEHAAAKCSKNKAELEADKAELEYREALRQHGKNYVEGEAHSEAETTAKHALDTAAENRRHAIEQKKIEEQKYSALGYGDAQERDQATGSDAGGRPPGGPPSGGLPPGGDGGSAGSGSGRGRDRPSSWRPLGGDGAETPFAERYRQTLIEAATGKEFDIVRLFGVVDAESNRLLEHVEDLKGSEYAVYNKYQKMLGHAGQVAVIRALNATEKDFISGVVHNEAAMKMLLKNLQESKRASVDVADKLIASIGRDDSTVLAALREDMATFLKGDKVTVATDRAQEILNASDPEELAEKLRDFVEYLRDNMDVQKILHDKDITDEVKEVITTYWTMFADNFKLEFTEAAKAVAEQIRRDVQHEMLDRQEAFALRMQKRWAVVSCISIFCGILSPNSLANTMINVGFTPLQRAIP
ncbi:MAG: hypothetical protein J2P37_13440, partial [Ktedonobacteraceae bacterium]|nr:hypothetical protein [Ktedonobacteraceae bacterium]